MEFFSFGHGKPRKVREFYKVKVLKNEIPVLESGQLFKV